MVSWSKLANQINKNRFIILVKKRGDVRWIDKLSLWIIRGVVGRARGGSERVCERVHFPEGWTHSRIVMRIFGRWVVYKKNTITVCVFIKPPFS